MVGKQVVIVANNEGNPCEPFVGLTGIAVEPFNRGCKKKDWYGVILDQHTIYGTKLNFHVSELKELS